MAKLYKETFVSYINEENAPLNLNNKLRNESKSSFTSYIDEENGLSPDNCKDQTDVDINELKMTNGHLEPNLLPGERIIGQADRVLRFNSFAGKKRGLSGKLFVTNFKITFITVEDPLQQTQQRERNLLIGDMDIPLAGIDRAYQGFSGGRRKRIGSNSGSSGKTKYLFVYCQNLRIHQFSFKFTPENQDRMIINSIVAFTFPNRPELLFALHYGQLNKRSDIKSEVPLFTTMQDWQTELSRLNCKGWMPVQANIFYTLCSSLPECFVIPRSVLIADLRRASHHFVQNRVPTWSYSYKNGSALIRMSSLTSESDDDDQEDRLHHAIATVHPSQRLPILFNLNKLCPSIRDLTQSFDKLKEVTMIDTAKEFWSTDVNWLSSLENTHWLQTVQTCLKIADEIVVELTEKGNSVVIKEGNSRDYSCVISSLVQLLIDSHYRTISGLQTLIQKEWVALGHPFQTHNNLIKKEGNSFTPLFLLFLDCIWQLLQQFVSHFEFTEMYLVALWDSVQLGLFETFLFDSVFQREKFCGKLQQGNSPVFAVCLPQVWQWALQYTADDLSLFRNPVYYNKIHDLKESIDADTDSVFPGPDAEEKRGSINSHYKEMYLESPLSDYALHLNSATPFISDSKNELILKPRLSLSFLKLWELCYLRWLTPNEIVHGGSQAEYLQRCILLDDILDLQDKVKAFDFKTEYNQQNDIISPRRVSQSQRLNCGYMTSSFPFETLSPREKVHGSFVFMPLTNYIRNSNISSDYSDDS